MVPELLTAVAKLGHAVPLRSEEKQVEPHGTESWNVGSKAQGLFCGRVPKRIEHTQFLHLLLSYFLFSLDTLSVKLSDGVFIVLFI